MTRWRRGAALVLVAAALVAVAAFGIRLTRRPAPPRVADLGAMAPEVRSLVKQHLSTIAENRANASAWARFGMVCEANGLLQAARGAYAQATALDPRDARSTYRLAVVDARAGRVDEAIAEMRQAIALDPHYAPANWRLGLWLLDRNDTGGAERAFARVAEIDPGDASAPAGLARVYLQRNENQRAVDVLEQSLAKRPGDRYALQLLGTAYRRLGRLDEADYALAVGMSGEPAWADPWTDEVMQFRRGFAVLLKDATQDFLSGNFDAAITKLEELRRQRPDDLALASHLGEVFVAAGRADQGIALLEGVVAKDPERFEAYINLASGYLQQNDLRRARTAIDRALAVNSTLGRAHAIKGLILWRAGDERSALAALKSAVRYDPRNAKALVWMGMVDMNLGRPADAIESFGRATRLDPALADGWVGVANAAMSLGALDRASEALARAGQLNPDAPGVKQASIRLQSLRR
jgi:tetratricopeptide (TPR) repeat protein